MGDADRRFGLVNVLAAGTLRAHCINFQIGIVDIDIHVFNFGKHRDGGGRGMNASGSFGIGDTLYAMHPRFKLELGENATAAHRGDDFLEAAFGAFADGQNFRLPALLGRITLVHSKEISGEKRGLVPACACADFKDRVVVVHRILWQKSQPDLLRQPVLAFLHLMSLDIGELAHFRVRRRIIDEG